MLKENRKNKKNKIPKREKKYQNKRKRIKEQLIPNKTRTTPKKKKKRKHWVNCPNPVPTYSWHHELFGDMNMLSVSYAVQVCHGGGQFQHAKPGVSNREPLRIPMR